MTTRSRSFTMEASPGMPGGSATTHLLSFFGESSPFENAPTMHRYYEAKHIGIRIKSMSASLD
jgi:hypothetical protein